MTAVAALGVYRAYRHVLHDRVRSYLGLYRADDDEVALLEEDARIEYTPEAPMQADTERDTPASVHTDAPTKTPVRAP